MLKHCEQEASAPIQVDLPRAAESAGLKALGADLPPELDAYLKKLVDAAMRRTAKGGVDVKRLLSSFATDNYTDTEFETTRAALDTSKSGVTSRSQLCAWLLGIPLLNEENQEKAAISLRSVLCKPPKSLIPPSATRILGALRLAGILAGVLLMVGSSTIGLMDLDPLPSMCLGIGIFLFLILYQLALFYIRQCQIDDAVDLRFIAAHALGRLRSVAAIDALAAACLEINEYVSKMATVSLRTVLPHLTSEHYGQLGSEAVPNLCQLLKRCFPLVTTAEHSDYRLALELFEALEKIGDARALPVVQQVFMDCKDTALTNAANRALAVLVERQRRETERGTLLRGAVQPTISEGELLRASISQAESKPEQLLRPAD